MDFSKYRDTFYGSLKVTVLLFAYCTVLTTLTWIAMYFVSFIPIPGLSGPGDIWNFKEMAVFGAGMVWGIMSIFMLMSKTDLEIKREDEGKVSIKL